MSFWRWQDGDILIDVKVQPRASRDGWAEVLGERIKIKITAPPVDGKANSHLCAWLGGQFGVAKSAVTVESGMTGRDKRLRIQNPRRLPTLLQQAT